MSSLFIAPGQREDAARAAAKLTFTPETRAFPESVGPLALGVTRVDAAHLWSPARDPKTGVVVALGGRLAFEEGEWAAGEPLPYEGGLACRIVLDRFLKQSADLAANLNGAGCVVILDPRTSELHVITDRLGVFPMFQWDGAEPWLCSHPDVLADLLKASGKPVTFDELTAAEYLATGRSVQPYTYYREIKMLEPASHYRWSRSGAVWTQTRETYWQPRYLTEPASDNINELADQLAVAFQRAVQRRTNPRLGRPGVMLSGGADSRMCVFGAHNPTQVACFTLYDEPNEELATARRIAQAAGATHTALERAPDYYMLNAGRSMELAGGMWSLVDAHFTGMIPRLAQEKLGTILTGCYADYMFKGLLLNRTLRRLLGRALPLYDLAPFQLQYYSPHFPVATRWQTAVDARLEASIPQTLRDDSPAHRLAVEDLRLRPLAREADTSGRSIFWRTLPWDHLISDKDVLDVYGKISPTAKLNGIPFGRAVATVCGKAGQGIANNNYGTPVGAGETARVVWFLLGVAKRKIQRLLGRAPKSGGATPGSWPVWDHYLAHSPEAARIWADVSPAERERFTGWLGEDPFKFTPAQAAARDPIWTARILALKIWLRQRGI